MNRKSVLVLAAAMIALLMTLAAGAADEPYKLLNKGIHVGGGNGWDYLTVDEAGRRLYVAHGNEVNVIDIDKETVVGKVENTPGVHGFLPVAELGRGFSTNGRGNSVSVVDLKTLMTLSQIPTGGNPDAVLYDPKNQEVYTFNGLGSTTIFNAKTGAVVQAALALGGKPETGVVDTAVGRVYVNIENRDEIAVIDTKTHTVVAHWPIAPGRGATGLAFDVKNHRLFIGAATASMMIVMDSTNGKVIANLPTGGGVDATAFDPATGYAFASAGRGGVTIVHQDSPDKYSVVQTLATANQARTMTLDPKTHKIYLAALEYAEPAAGAAPAAGGRAGGRGAAATPDSFKVMVFGLSK